MMKTKFQRMNIQPSMTVIHPAIRRRQYHAAIVSASTLQRLAQAADARRIERGRLLETGHGRVTRTVQLSHTRIR